MAKGVSLLELVAGIFITGGVTLAIVKFSSSALQANKNSNLRARTEQKMRLFLERQKKHIVSSLPFEPSQLLNNNCSILGVAPTATDCGNSNKVFTTLILKRFNNPLKPAEFFTETITTMCVPAPTNVNIDPNTLALMNSCTPCEPRMVPVVRTRFSNNSTVLRFSGAQENSANSNIADDGSTLASALCITHGPLATGDPNSFTLLNLRLRTLVLQNKEARLLEMVASIPTPRPQPGGVRVLSSGN